MCKLYIQKSPQCAFIYVNLNQHAKISTWHDRQTASRMIKGEGAGGWDVANFVLYDSSRGKGRGHLIYLITWPLINIFKWNAATLANYFTWRGALFLAQTKPLPLSTHTHNMMTGWTSGRVNIMHAWLPTGTVRRPASGWASDSAHLANAQLGFGFGFGWVWTWLWFWFRL